MRLGVSAWGGAGDGLVSYDEFRQCVASLGLKMPARADRVLKHRVAGAPVFRSLNEAFDQQFSDLALQAAGLAAPAWPGVCSGHRIACNA